MGGLTVTLLLLLWMICFLLGVTGGWMLRGKMEAGEAKKVIPPLLRGKIKKPPSEAARKAAIEYENIENFGTSKKQREVR